MSTIRGRRSYLDDSTVDVQDSSSFGSIAALGINGLAGLGPGFSSVVRNSIGTKGDTLLDNIFQVRVAVITTPCSAADPVPSIPRSAEQNHVQLHHFPLEPQN